MKVIARKKLTTDYKQQNEIFTTNQLTSNFVAQSHVWRKILSPDCDVKTAEDVMHMTHIKAMI